VMADRRVLGWLENRHAAITRGAAIRRRNNLEPPLSMSVFPVPTRSPMLLQYPRQKHPGV
jgi:hypothetical protein